MTRKLALVTGASTGIGFELAKIAAREGYDLLVAANEPQIYEAAKQIAARHNMLVIGAEVDLSTPAGVEDLLAHAGGRPIDIACANAGVGTGGAFMDQDVQDWRHSIDTNVTGTLYFIQKVLAGMIAHGQGRMLVTGSIAGYIPGSFNAVYNATKAFIDNFTEALRNELREHEGIILTTLMPGATQTDFFARAGMLDTKLGQDDKADPAKVAQDGWDAMMAGKGHVVSGFVNKLQVAGSGLLPQSLLAEQHRKLAEPGSAQR